MNPLDFHFDRPIFGPLGGQKLRKIGVSGDLWKIYPSNCYETSYIYFLGVLHEPAWFSFWLANFWPSGWPKTCQKIWICSVLTGCSILNTANQVEWLEWGYIVPFMGTACFDRPIFGTLGGQKIIKIGVSGDLWKIYPSNCYETSYIYFLGVLHEPAWFSFWLANFWHSGGPKI